MRHNLEEQGLWVHIHLVHLIYLFIYFFLLNSSNAETVDDSSVIYSSIKVAWRIVACDHITEHASTFSYFEFSMK